MNRRSFFRLVAGLVAWGQTKHLAWVFPEPVHAIPQRFLTSRLKFTREVMATDKQGAFVKAAIAEWMGMTRDVEWDEERWLVLHRAGLLRGRDR